MSNHTKGKKILSLKNYLITYLLILLFIATTTMAFVWLFHEKIELRKRIAGLNEMNLQKDKDFVREETQLAIKNILFLRDVLSDIPEDTLKKKILKEVAGWRTDYGGYLFINTIEGQALIFDGKLVRETKNISDMTDPSGLRLFNIEKQAFNNPDGVYMMYQFKKMNSNIPEPKISYIMSIPDWGWLIGVGIYRSDTQELTNNLTKQYIADYKNELVLIFIIFFGIAGIAYFFVYRINRKIRTDINQLRNYFELASKQDKTINIDKLRFNQFIIIGKELNKMIKKRVSLKKKVAEREERIQSIFNAAENIGFIFTNMDQPHVRIIDFSPGAENIFKYRREGLDNKRLDLLLSKKNSDQLKSVIENIGQEKAGFHDEIEFIRKDASVFTALVSVHPMFKDQVLVGTIMVLVDITKRKDAELELVSYQINLEKMVESRTHEIEEKNKELLDKNSELERFNDLFVGREFRIKELRDQVKLLEKKIEEN